MLQGLGEGSLLRILSSKLDSARHDVALQALYVLVNMATGGSFSKGIIMEEKALLARIKAFLVRLPPFPSRWANASPTQ